MNEEKSPAEKVLDAITLAWIIWTVVIILSHILKALTRIHEAYISLFKTDKGKVRAALVVVYLGWWMIIAWIWHCYEGLYTEQYVLATCVFTFAPYCFFQRYHPFDYLCGDQHFFAKYGIEHPVWNPPPPPPPPPLPKAPVAEWVKKAEGKSLDEPVYVFGKDWVSRYVGKTEKELAKEARDRAAKHRKLVWHHPKL
jgi:hypothetical protein